MVMLNDLDRYHLALDVIDNVPGLATSAAVVRQHLLDERARAKVWTIEHGLDRPEIAEWRWPTSG
jgi:xylulose-5-phosphate/fructose-6-phosphate phosphoketolase